MSNTLLALAALVIVSIAGLLIRSMRASARAEGAADEKTRQMEAVTDAVETRKQVEDDVARRSPADNRERLRGWSRGG